MSNPPPAAPPPGGGAGGGGASSSSSASASSSSPDEDRPSRPRTYFCHECNRRIQQQDVTEDFTCRRCHSGFIEEVQESQEAADDPGDPYGEDEHLQPGGNPFFGGHQMDIMNYILGSLLANGGPGGPGTGGAGGGGIRIRQVPMPGGSRGGGGGISVGGGGFGVPHAGAVGGHPNPFLQDLLSNLAGIQPPEGAGPHIQFIPGGVTMYGNPGDYVWGRGGLDAIVTQLLNQMDGTGPPPLRGDTIKNIPKVRVTQEHVDAHAQCSVCWEDFKLDEDVRQLNCEHIYHEACIVPWLELHGTCPVCRRSQEKEDSPTATSSGHASAAPGEGTSSQAAPQSSLGNTISSVFNLFGFQSPSASGNQASRTSTPSTAESSRNQGSQGNQGNAEGNNEGGQSGRSRFEDFDLE